MELFSQPLEIWSVKQLTARLRRMMREGFGNVRVTGEISGLKIATSGHAYFNLKEEDTVLACTLFRNSLRLVRFPLKDGLKVQARGAVDIYEQRGSYQLNVEHLEVVGAGELQRAFEQLKAKLLEEGLFDADSKRPLPRFPRRIGIVTSPTGAVIQDMLNIFERRCPGLSIRIYPALVQGPGSVEQIMAGLEYFNREPWADVLILARGGGGLEDLWSFNDESLARAIFASHIPIVSAVGHETDFTIADFVADLRAPTPSAAAELIAPDLRAALDQLTVVERTLRRATEIRMARLRESLARHGAERVRSIVALRIQRQWQRNDEAVAAMERSLAARSANVVSRLHQAATKLVALDPRVQLAKRNDRLREIEARLQRAIAARLAQLSRQRELLATLQTRLRSLASTKLNQSIQRVALATDGLTKLSPLAILHRGYAVAFDQKGRIIRNAAEVQPGAELRVRVAQGQFLAQRKKE